MLSKRGSDISRRFGLVFAELSITDPETDKENYNTLKNALSLILSEWTERKERHSIRLCGTKYKIVVLPKYIDC
jgi:hypothetical protein